MATIDIRHRHRQSLKAAKAVVEETAVDLGRKFGLATEWDGDTLHFRRSGVNGQIHVTKAEVRVRAELGFLLSALKPMIESEIENHLVRHFGTPV
jgi:putative polyhydroxyalkanoate system protein